MNLGTLNLWAIFLAALSAFLIGGLWYSGALLGGAWKRANGFGEQIAGASPKVFLLAFLQV